jgi:hypothetical protein
VQTFIIVVLLIKQIEQVGSSGKMVVPSINHNQDTNWSWDSVISTETGLAAVRLRNLGANPAKLEIHIFSKAS